MHHNNKIYNQTTIFKVKQLLSNGYFDSLISEIKSNNFNSFEETVKKDLNYKEFFHFYLILINDILNTNDALLLTVNKKLFLRTQFNDIDIKSFSFPHPAFILFLDNNFDLEDYNVNSFDESHINFIYDLSNNDFHMLLSYNRKFLYSLNEVNLIDFHKTTGIEIDDNYKFLWNRYKSGFVDFLTMIISEHLVDDDFIEKLINDLLFVSHIPKLMLSILKHYNIKNNDHNDSTEYSNLNICDVKDDVLLTILRKYPEDEIVYHIIDINYHSKNVINYIFFESGHLNAILHYINNYALHYDLIMDILGFHKNKEIVKSIVKNNFLDNALTNMIQSNFPNDYQKLLNKRDDIRGY